MATPRCLVLWRPVLSVAAALLAAVLTSACTGSFEDFERAVELATQKGTATMENDVVVRSSSGEPGEELKIHVAAAFDLEADRGELTMEFIPPPGEEGPSPCRMVMEGKTTYMKVAGGPGWLEADLAGLQAEQAQAAPSDPREAFEFLGAVFGDVDAIGPEQIRGVDTTHWTVFVDVDRLAEGRQGAKRGFLGSLLKNKLPLDVWIDKDGLPRRIAYKISNPTPDGSLEVESSTDIFDYGKPVSITVPAPADVRDEPNPLVAMLACMGAPIGDGIPPPVPVT